MIAKQWWRLPVLASLVPLLAACGGAQTGTIDDSKAVCKPGQQWDGAQCVGAPEGAAPEGDDTSAASP